MGIVADLGLNKSQSSRWQKLAAMPEARFEEAVAQAQKVAGSVTTATLLRAAREGARRTGVVS